MAIHKSYEEYAKDRKTAQSLYYRPNLVFSMYMKSILGLDASNAVDNTFADLQLVGAAKHEMEKRMRHESMNGRYGWWDRNVISLEKLYRLRDRALQVSDHVSVLNYTAMIAMRETFELRPEMNGNPTPRPQSQGQKE